MESRDLQKIRQIKIYCEEVADTVRRFGADYDIFSADKDYIKSVSMSIMQIGEASIGLTDEFKDATKREMPWKAIRGMRNMYAHAYATLSKSEVWSTVTTDLPELLKFCNRIIVEYTEKEKPQINQKPSILAQIDEHKNIISHNAGNRSKKKNEPEL